LNAFRRLRRCWLLQHLLEPLAPKLHLKLALLVKIKVSRPAIDGSQQAPNNRNSNEQPGYYEISDA